MIRLVAFIVVFAVFLVFIVLNLDNKCDISFGFKTFNQIPVFITVFSSFVLGMLFAVPLAVSLFRKRRKASQDMSPDSQLPGEKKKRRGLKNNNSPANTANDTILSSPDEIKKETSSYGID